jgi:hypothetical protein
MLAGQELYHLSHSTNPPLSSSLNFLGSQEENKSRKFVGVIIHMRPFSSLSSSHTCSLSCPHFSSFFNLNDILKMVKNISTFLTFGYTEKFKDYTNSLRWVGLNPGPHHVLYH